jgi:hypothetical protein
MTNHNLPEGDPPGTLTAITVPGLRVSLVALGPGEAIYRPDAMPAPAPLPADELHPLPSFLPDDLSPRQLGDAYCAVDGDGVFQVTWIELLVPAGETLHLPWDRAEGEPPAMQGFRFKGREAVAVAASWSMVSSERLPVVITRAGPDTCWLVGGRLPIEDLARVAVSLPGG